MEKFNTSGITPDPGTYASMIHLSCVFHDETRAFKLYQEMKGNGMNPRPIIYQKLLRLYVDNLQLVVQKMKSGLHTFIPL